MPFPTSCFIIGAQKAGTTTLASLLESQSALCVSSPKEPLFFSKHYAKGTQWYETCFHHPEKSVLIDAKSYEQTSSGRGMPVSNVCAAIRKDVWQNIRYDETIEGGEDGLWTCKILKEGYSYLYQAKAVVIASITNIGNVREVFQLLYSPMILTRTRFFLLPSNSP